jgi:hypothetical protein
MRKRMHWWIQEFQTPIITSSSPEGARFLDPVAPVPAGNSTALSRETTAVQTADHGHGYIFQIACGTKTRARTDPPQISPT